MSAVPTVYATLAQLPVDADIASMRFAIVGASALPISVREHFESRTGIPLVEGYGLTEATCASARSFPDHRRPGSVGQRLPYQQIVASASHADGPPQPLPPGAVGHLYIKGPTVFAGYVTGCDTTGFRLTHHGTIIDGWLDTGDLGSVDGEGFVYLRGRAKDLIIRGGHNIDPAIVEDALLSHPEVTAAAAVGRPDVHAGEVPAAYVSLQPGASVTAEALRAWAREHVNEPAAAPKHITIRDALPLTPVGKPYKLPLRADAIVCAARDALSGIGLRRTDICDEDGASVLVVALDDGTDHDRAHSILSQFSFTYRLITPSP